MHKIQIKTETNTNKEKTVTIDDTLFEIALRKGLIEKIGDDYVFIGEYEELLAFKRKKDFGKTFEWLDWSDINVEGVWDLFDSPLLASRPPHLPPNFVN